MNTCLLVTALVASNVLGQTMYEGDIETQDKAFQKLWGTEFNWKLDALPKTAKVEAERLPYSGYIYPDTHGGTFEAMQKYDRAFRQNGLAAAFERRDTSITETTRRPVTYTQRFGFRGSRTVTRWQTVSHVPYWYGHCNGWTSATIRHAEPQKSVKRNGVTFTPSDIKGLLAEIYIYNDNEMLAEGYVHPAVLHAVLANWIGRGKHPIGVEADPGSEKWNYPIYAYKANVYNQSAGHADVQMTITYAMNRDTQADKGDLTPREKYFHYHLNLDTDGMIVGGYYYRDSSAIEMLWIPLKPKAGGEEGNERGNPHLDIDEVLAIWRESVPEKTRQAWAHVDPTLEDKLDTTVQFAHLRPAQPQLATPLLAAGTSDLLSEPTTQLASASSDDGDVATTALDLPVEELDVTGISMP